MMKKQTSPKAPNIKVESVGCFVAPRRVTSEMLTVLERMLNEGSWPSFERPDYLNELGNVAKESIRKKTLEGNLAAVLLYHQLVDEALKVLIDDVRLFVQWKVFPSTISFCPPDKKVMSGRLIAELKESISFQGKDELLAKAEQLNKVRVTVVHKLAKQPSLEQIAPLCSKVHDIAEEFFKMFNEVHYLFRQFFKQHWSGADAFCSLHGIPIKHKQQ